MNRVDFAKPLEGVTFQPWIGEAYREQQSLAAEGKTACCDGLWHVMGESHYGDPADKSVGFTADVFAQRALSGYAFFDAILSVVSGQDIDVDNRASTWSQFAFSNYVQDILPDEARRPSQRDWEQARLCFFSQLAITRPKQLLVIGAEQWENLPSEGFTPIETLTGTPSVRRDDIGMYAYEVDGEQCFTLATWIYHPSSRGLLKVADARERVRALTMASCNILSDLGRDEQGWFYDPADR